MKEPQYLSPLKPFYLVIALPEDHRSSKPVSSTTRPHLIPWTWSKKLLHAFFLHLLALTRAQGHERARASPMSPYANLRPLTVVLLIAGDLSPSPILFPLL